jgi:O-antigen ligase
MNVPKPVPGLPHRPDRVAAILELFLAAAVLGLVTRQVVAGVASGPTPLVICAMAAAGAVVGLFFGSTGLAAVVASTAMVEGLRRTGMFWYGSVTSTLAGGLLLGWIVRGALSFRPGGAISWPGRRIALLWGFLVVAACVRTLPVSAWSDERFWTEPEFGYGDVYYAAESAKNWLFIMALWYGWRRFHGSACARISQIVAGCLVITVAGFAAFQWSTNIPHLYPSGIGRGAITSPSGDIHALGTLTTWLVVLSAGMVLRASPVRRTAWIACFLGAGIVTFLTWSRASWLGCFVGLTGVAWDRLPRRHFAILGGLLLASLLVLNLVPLRMLPAGGYGGRLMNLVRLREAPSRDQDRVFLWRKAAAMIADAPLWGHGPGQFYRLSPKFAAPNDPLGDIPNFPHDLALQAWAEFGSGAIVLALAFLAVTWCNHRREGNSPRAGMWAFLALAVTQLTANSLVIYPDQQIYAAWALVLALASSAGPEQKAGDIRLA